MSLLGQGAFGKVFKEKIGGVTCAVKRIKNFDQEAMKEVVTLVQLDSKYIIRLRGFLLEDRDRQLCIIMEYADRGTFADFVVGEALKTHTMCFKEHSIWRGLRHLALALSYLHNFRPQPILHRDLKPDNILGVGQRGGGFFWKLADFGLATLLSEDAKGNYYTAGGAGTPTYMAPEVWADYQSYSFGADLWSLGCVLVFRCNNGRHLFFEGEDVLRWRGAGKNTLAPSHHTTSSSYSSGLVQLVARLLDPNPKLRLSADEVLAECTMERMSPPRRRTGEENRLGTKILMRKTSG